jgi:hypothetical protein
MSGAGGKICTKISNKQVAVPLEWPSVWQAALKDIEWPSTGRFTKEFKRRSRMI